MKASLVWLTGMLFLATSAAAAGVPTQAVAVSYPSGNETVAGYLVTPAGTGPFPAVVVIHEWWRDWLILLAGVLISAFILAHGLLMLFSPKRHLSFLDWLGRADQWSEPNPTWKPQLSLAYRLAGLVLTVLSLAAMAVAILLMLTPMPPPMGQQQPVQQPAKPDWYSLAIGLLILGGGLFALFRPEVLTRWAVKFVPHRRIPERTLRNWTFRARIMAIMMIIAGIIALRAVFR